MIPRVTLLYTRKQKRGSCGIYHNSPFDTLMGRAGGETPALMYYFPRPLRGGEDSPLCAYGRNYTKYNLVVKRGLILWYNTSQNWRLNRR